MKNRTTLFNANHLALMHGLSINPTPHREAEYVENNQDNPRAVRRPAWWITLIHLLQTHLDK